MGSSKQIIDIRQDFRVVFKGAIVCETKELDTALIEAACQDGDADVQQAVEFSSFGKKPVTSWISVFDMDGLNLT